MILKEENYVFYLKTNNSKKEEDFYRTINYYIRHLIKIIAKYCNKFNEEKQTLDIDDVSLWTEVCRFIFPPYISMKVVWTRTGLEIALLSSVVSNHFLFIETRFIAWEKCLSG